MKRWGIEPIDWLSNNPESVDELYRKDPISLQVCNEVAIALAFAVIKMRAKCPSDVAQFGLTALKRTALLIEESKLSDELKSEWKVAEEKMVAKLKACQS